MSMVVKVTIAVVVAMAVFSLALFWRGFFYPHAFLVAVACGALAYSTLRAVERLGNLYRKRDDS
ncbi:MAG: hypothetical protein AAF604_17065 [Acidobacteriota bacterium]